MKTRNGLFADVSEADWNDWKWQIRNRAETVEELKEAGLTLTPRKRKACASACKACVWR